MAEFSKRGWNSDFNENNFTSDQLERFTDRQRDSLYGRHDPVARPGKVVHVHPHFGEAPRETTSAEKLAVTEDAARSGLVQYQFLAGCEYAKLGDFGKARYWLGKAAMRGWPGAQEEMARLNGS